MSNAEDYTIGWVCAVQPEFVAAQVFLDEKHPSLAFQDAEDNNIYKLGKIGKHNVAIACLPLRNYGLVNAATVARDMLRTFHNMRFGLMVGIAGGVPTTHDIRLGDVVVSSVDGDKGAVFQYDFGKTIQSHKFETTGHLNSPPLLLQAAVQERKTEYEIHGNDIDATVAATLDKFPRLRGKYQRPDQDADRLYRSGYEHQGLPEQDCVSVCGLDEANLVSRTPRPEIQDKSTVHYGLVASANQLMKDAEMRDSLARQKGVLCFEMEAAGLINHFPCLMIRGICDYSDSHKNDTWQGYAAMVAAAYAKDLLYQIPPSKVEHEQTISLETIEKYLKDSSDTARETLRAQQDQLQFHKDRAKERLSKEEEEIRHLFRLATPGSDVTYEWYKERVQERLEGTCQWFLAHENFQTWLQQDAGPLLVSADPGCGKSVLAKFLIDQVLPQEAPMATICYFFFKDQDQDTIRQALCAILHQLFCRRPDLIEHAKAQWEKDGDNIVASTNSLWHILEKAARDPRAGPIIVVLDALDECAEEEFKQLVDYVTRQFDGGRDGPGKLRYLLTSRPYDRVITRFYRLSYIHIPGEDKSDAISKEVDIVITHRVHELSQRRSLPLEIERSLEGQLKEPVHRTYLWVHLIFESLEEEIFEQTPDGVAEAIAQLPDSVNEAYEKILCKSKQHHMVRKALSIILLAARPLSITEMRLAVKIDDKLQPTSDLCLEDNERFCKRLRSWCGLSVCINHGRIYFLHQTVREFLLADAASLPSPSAPPTWHHSINARDAHTVLAEACVRYLYGYNDGSVFNPGFLIYAAEAWVTHFRGAGISEGNALVDLALNISDPASKSFIYWFRIHQRAMRRQLVIPAGDFTQLMVVSWIGLLPIGKMLLHQGATLDAQDRDGNTPLHAAAASGHQFVVKLLLDQGATVDARNKDGETPLHVAASIGDQAVVKLLVHYGAVVNARDDVSETPLYKAITWEKEAIFRLLSAHGADVNASDTQGRTPLHRAAANASTSTLQTLLELGAGAADLANTERRSPTCLAAQKRGLGLVAKLATSDTHVNTPDHFGATLLSLAARHSRLDSVQFLLQIPHVDIMRPDRFGRTAFWWVAPGEMNDVLVQAAEHQGVYRDVPRSPHPLYSDSREDPNWLSRCGICTMYMPYPQPYFRCNQCVGGHFRTCDECHERGARCLDDGHFLYRIDYPGIE